MVGFSLKKPGDKSNGVGFSLRKTTSTSTKPLVKKTSAFGKVDVDDEVKTVKIDTVDEEGAYDKATGPQKAKGPLVIPNAGNSNWKEVAKERFSSGKGEEEQQQNLAYGINFTEANPVIKDQEEKSRLLLQRTEILDFKKDVESRPNMATLDEYDSVPVAEFGAAMLRGMGWISEDKKEGNASEKEAKAQRSQFLGLGAKDINPGERPERYYNPVKRINSDTRSEAPPERSRSKSPTRKLNYRSRD